MNLLEITTPINIEEEKIKFFNSKTYNPIFKYKWEEKDIVNLYQSKKSNLKRAILKQNHQEIIQTAQSYFETEIAEKELELAKKYTHDTPLPVKERLEDLAKAFQAAFDYFELDYKIILSNKKGFNIRPQQSKKRIIISKSAELDFFSIDGEVKHEMTHILRYENEKYNKIIRDKNFLPTEEGLACYMHDFNSPNGLSSLFQHSAEYIATQIGLKGTLRDIFNYFISIGFSEELEWQRSIRHKFGFKDTSKRGDFIKPAMYFYHSLKIQNLSENERWRLFVGKISINSLPEYPEYKGKYPLEKIQKFYKLKFYKNKQKTIQIPLNFKVNF